MRELNVTNPRRNLLPQNHVLPGRSIIHLPWPVFRGPNPRTHTTKSQGSPFRDLPSSPPYKARTGNQQRSQTYSRYRPTSSSSSTRNDSRDQGQRRQDKEPKGPQSALPFNRKGQGTEAVKAANRNEQLPVVGKLVLFKDVWTKLSPQHPEIVRKVSQGILIAFDDVPPSLLHYPLELPSNNKAANLQNAVQKLRLSRAIEEVMDITSPGYYSPLFLVPKPDGSFRPFIDLKKLNQFLVVPSFKMETLFSIIAALQPQEWIKKIDLKDAYHHIMVHVNIRKYFQGCQPVRNFRILHGSYMQNTGVRIWSSKYGNWALSVLSLKVLLPELSLPVLGSKSVKICAILCLKTFKYLFNHQNIHSSLFHM